ncbi:MAG: TonB C-terminal domain-containing protein [Deltaproteobacteria bacterium]|nr:TonB C-terminal domain-containing protein [Candidatus Tharpella aukensis]
MRILLPLFAGKERSFKLALCLSFILHILILIPYPQFKSRPFLNPDNLMEVKLEALKPMPRRQPKPSPPPAKPSFKRKIKTKIKKKPAILKKQKIVAKESPLAKRRSVPKKKSAPANDKLAEIKKRLSQQREAQKLNDIRQRLRQESSPAVRAKQASLTQVYNNQLKAWLMRNWHLPEHLLNSGLEATISLTIDASGQLLEQSEEKLSSNSTFNHAMRQAIVNATPFPPFPAELNIPQEEFVITFDPNNLKP